ncbi:MAG: undecaprenyl/decaprenyl-phosphate alpha-N-acetylglucosaminyl 1-phosphate transferase [Sphingobacteriales bacterium]|nr:MAG: undecaprenyl/decaprenyl-phosphate alpha-N-acetylglucosaminyl 1-phosphate transferase [Sphingobacteriales bacterium]
MIPSQPAILYIIAFVCALVICLSSIPRIIYVSSRKRLFDVPDNQRKLHTRVVPNLGGLGIFFAYIITASFFVMPGSFNDWHFIAAACLLLFLLGIVDDLISLSPSKKFLAQFIPSVIIVFFANIRLTSLHGLFGIHELPYWISIGFSIVGCVFVTNAFNLIDGVDGLAGSCGLLYCLFLGTCLASMGKVSEAVVAFSMAGAIVGFLRYNIAPARIFMGDTGSLMIGFIVSVLAILFINSYDPATYSSTILSNYITTPQALLATGLAVLSVPVFDCFRVFVTRIATGGSPFRADRIHIHHYLQDAGLKATQLDVCIVLLNALIIGVTIAMQNFDTTLIVACQLALYLVTFVVLAYIRKTKIRAKAQLSHAVKGA